MNGRQHYNKRSYVGLHCSTHHVPAIREAQKWEKVILYKLGTVEPFRRAEIRGHYASPLMAVPTRWDRRPKSRPPSCSSAHGSVNYQYGETGD